MAPPWLLSPEVLGASCRGFEARLAAEVLRWRDAAGAVSECGSSASSLTLCASRCTHAAT